MAATGTGRAVAKRLSRDMSLSNGNRPAIRQGKKAMTTNMQTNPDAIVTAVSGYEPEHVAIWFNSLRKAGFVGKIFVIAYDVSEALVEYLQAGGAVVFTFDHDKARKRYRYSQLKEELADHDDDGKLRVDSRWTWTRRILRFTDKIADRRFYHSSVLLEDYCKKTGENFRYLAFSDSRDVAFQANPFDWLAANLPEDKDFVVSREVVTHREPWNRRMMIKGFGKRGYQRVQDEPVVCAGFFAGRFKPMLDLILTNYYMDQSKRIGDQASFNQIFTFDNWREKTVFTDWTIPWTLHSSTVNKPSSTPGFYATEDSLPDFGEDLVRTCKGEPFAVVHHHDRHEALNKSLTERFGQV